MTPCDFLLRLHNDSQIPIFFGVPIASNPETRLQDGVPSLTGYVGYPFVYKYMPKALNPDVSNPRALCGEDSSLYPFCSRVYQKPFTSHRFMGQTLDSSNPEP